MINGGIIGKTNEAKFKYRMQELREQTEISMAAKAQDTLIEDGNLLIRAKVNAGNLLQEMIGAENSPLPSDFDESQITDNIKDILKNIKNQEEKYLVIYEGEMCYVSQNTLPNNTEQEKWCRELGIRILEFRQPEGIQIANGDYVNINGLYMCTPDVSKFVKEKTRYLRLNSQGNLVTTNYFATSWPEEGWYDYNNKQWANLYVENEGNNIIYVWIPRYAYKQKEGTTAGAERADVVFIDTNNNHKYIDEQGQEQTKTWKQLQEEGYIVPAAFGFGDNDTDMTQNTQIPGYWITKYVLGEISGYPVQYDLGIQNGAIVPQNIQTNITNLKNNQGVTPTVSKYQYALNGVVKATTTSPEEYKFTTLRKGMNTITVSLLDENDEIIGSLTKEYEVSEANAPNLDGFDKQNTYYVTYDANQNEHSTIPITQKAPDNWYGYAEKRWANIVVRENGAETYYTWIPRYAYKAVSGQTAGQERATIKFLEGTSSNISSGYIIPAAFGWGDDDNDMTTNTQLTGYWISKYVLGTSNTSDLNTEYTTTSGTITTQGVTGTLVGENQKYIYWVDGNKITETTNAEEKITYSGLESGKSYTILIEVRNIANGELIGTITKEATTNSANVPNLDGFDNDTSDGDNTMTYYVTYGDDGNGEEDSSHPITEPAPSNWYNYAEKRWANIVVKKTDDSGNIVARTYYTWVPRYAYRAVTDKQRADIIFLNGTESNIPKDYILPAAFGFGDNDTDMSQNTQITGYWITKYVLGTNP